MADFVLVAASWAKPKSYKQPKFIVFTNDNNGNNSSSKKKNIIVWFQVNDKMKL